MILYDKGSTIGTAEGTTFTLNDTAKDRLLRFLKYYGNTTQSGTPTPSSPQPINVVTGNNVIDIVNSSIPNGYRRVDYIESNGISYIDTGVIPTSSTKIDIDFAYLGNTGSNWIALYGERDTSTSTYFGLYINASSLKLASNYAGFDGGYSSNVTITTNTKYNVKNDGGKLYLNNELKNNQSTNNTLVTSTKSIYLFDIHQANDYPQGRQINARIYQCKFYEGNTLIRDMIPCYRVSDNVIGMYDLVNNVFYTNSGTGTFTCGERVDEYQSYEINLGKNLWDWTQNNITLIKSTNRTTNIYPTSSIILEAGTYTISFPNLEMANNNYNMNIQMLGVENYGEQLINKSRTFTINEKKTLTRLYVYLSSSDNDNATATFSEIQLEKGSQATSYSPYKTPIELNKINNYVDFIDKSKGINLLNKENIVKTTNATTITIVDSVVNIKNTSNGYGGKIEISDLKPNTDYYLSYNWKNISNGINRVFVFAGTTQTTTLAYLVDGNGFTFNSGENDTINIWFYAKQNGTGEVEYSNIMLNKGTTAQEYEPYGTQWYIKKSIGKVVLDGSETSWEKVSANTNYYKIENYFNAKVLTSYASGRILCSHFVESTSGNYDGTSNKCWFNNAGTGFRVGAVEQTSVANWKSWLSSNNVSVYYILNTPTYTIITDNELVEQLEALYNAVTYDNVTNILQSNTGLPLYTYLQFVKPLDFSRNGLGYLNNVLSSQITDEINGEYSLTFEYPMSEPMASEIVEDRYVKEKVADGTSQIFVIRKIQKDFDKMSVYCTHLFYLLNDDFLEDVYPQNLSPKPFLDWLLAKANYQLPFIANSDIATSKTARYVRKNVVESILGNTDNSMYSLWGMELKRDNWNIGLKARLGADKGEKLIFGKNITGINLSIDTTGIYTRIMPIGFDGLLLPEKYIDADNINDYPYPRICLYQFSNIRYDPNDPTAYQTLDDAYQALRDATQELFNKGINRPSINVQIDWVELSKTEEYKQYSALERVELGDTIHCEVLGMNYDARVIKTIYNALTDRIDYFEIGSAKPSITSTMNQLDYDIVNLPQSMLDEAQANATQLITQAMGGYVYKTNSELYIMDNPDPAQAVKVWRWNINGLGYSSTGINGTYGIAMTMDGSIVADFITTGQLNTGVIEGYDSLVTTVNGNGIKIDNNYQELLGMFGNYTPTSTTTELQSKVTNIQTNTYTKQQIDTKLVDGSVQKVMTTSGTFDINGMHYERTNAQTKTTINEVGVGVRKTDGTDDYILFAGYVNPNNSQFSDYEGQTIVASENILVKNYLVIGNNSRMENYENGTGVFYIGG